MASQQERDVGETLLEVVISILFIGLVIVTLVGGIGTAVTLSGSHRELTISDVDLKAGAEAVKGATYTPGATPAAGAYAAVLPTLPSPYSWGSVTVRCVPKSTAASYSTSAASACTAAADEGLQLVTLRVSTADGTVSETTTLSKRKAS